MGKTAVAKGRSDKNFGEMVTPFAMFRDSNKTRQA